MHLPVRPVRGTLEFRDEPAMTKAIEFSPRHRPEAFAAGQSLCRSIRSEVDVAITRIEKQGDLRFREPVLSGGDISAAGASEACQKTSARSKVSGRRSQREDSRSRASSQR